MPGPEDLQALAQAWLDACVEALDTIPTYAPLLLRGAPSRRFTAAGTPVWDCCDQLAVHVSAIAEMPTSPASQMPSGKRYASGWKNQVTLTATITRCVPTGELNNTSGEYIPPDVAELTKSSKQINADGWALWNHLHNLQAAGLLLTLCSNVVFQGVTPVTPSGGCAGWTAKAIASLDGYDEVFGT